MPSDHKLAIIGLGDVAIKRHLPVLAQHPHLKITAAADLNPERASRAARDFSIQNISFDPLAVITSADAEAIAILTPPSTHAALAHAALDAGKHVFIEKPMTFDVREAEQLAEHAGRAQTRVLVGFNQRHHLQIQAARQMIQSGQLGTLRTVSSFLGNTHRRETGDAWRRNLTQGGDPFFEYGVHHFDLLRYLLDANVTELSAVESITDDGAVSIATQMRFANGVLANTTIAEDTVEHNVFEIVGMRGKLNLNLYRFDGLQFTPRGVFDGSFGLRLSDAGKTFASLPSALSRIRRGGDYVLTYRAEWDHLCAILDDGVAPLASARDGLEATRIAHAARQSVIQRAPVTL